MIKFIIFYAIGFIFYLDKFTRYSFKLVFNALIVQLKTLPLKEVYNFLNDLLSGKQTDNSILSKITVPLGLNRRNLCDTKPKKIFLLGLTFIILLNRSFCLIKNFLLWPFKLGIFSFIFSITGFDVSWFLNLFNLFPINIPQWIYVQYLLLYGNWMNWWLNTVNIKSLKTFSLPGSSSLPKNNYKEVLDRVEINNDDSDNRLIVNKKRFYLALGAMVLTAVAI